MKDSKIIWFAVTGLVVGLLAYFFGGNDRDGMSVEDSLAKARAAKAAKAKAEAEAKAGEEKENLAKQDLGDNDTTDS